MVASRMLASRMLAVPMLAARTVAARVVIWLVGRWWLWLAGRRRRAGSVSLKGFWRSGVAESRECQPQGS